jgi:hypothetical protein
MKASAIILHLFGCYAAHAETSSLREPSQYDARIVGGLDAQAGAYPFMGKEQESICFNQANFD